jgi:predicted ArsR family transcriptional regulator
MKTTITQSAFIDAFTSAGRSTQFSHTALKLIFDFIEQVEEDTGEEIELDVVAICCDYVESTTAEVIDYYSIEVEEGYDEVDAVREYLHNYTIVVGETPSGFVYLQF